MQGDLLKLLRDDTFWSFMGMEPVKVTPQEAELKISLKPHHFQTFGVVHGGVFASIIDAAVGAMVVAQMTEGQKTATIELKVNYLKPGLGGDIVARARRVSTGNRVVVGEVEVYNDKQELLAIGIATYLVW
ncbi:MULTISPECIES: PaaI family thioesterase [Carboxydothermus]|uniref:Medium/long-chain acyl-CoA thioesterase YigI n=2 Tax=Carboxydothermus TaxID=129957 RepID=Q3A9H4_CARHZ|nr:MULTISPECIES: PaaI family thioesterase [Carboxydothermus]ABB14213.1 thioesterase family protein [Carboxydothermus hydrogenoformans Z-2901]NYE57854.1 acyl-CoA thioesterase [Carboxydothermus ferrireducens DSM 11255]